MNLLKNKLFIKIWNCFRADEHFDNRPANTSFDGMNKNENEVLLECSEDVPFSPLRQSYTPLPMNQFNGNETDEIITADEIPPSVRQNILDANKDLQILDIKFSEPELMDDINDDDDQAIDDDQPNDENGNMSISKENVVLFTIDATGDGESIIFINSIIHLYIICSDILCQYFTG